MMKTRKGHPVYPLTVAQKFHLFYQAFCPKKEVLNIGTSLTIDTEIDWEVLRASIYKAYERSEGMRIEDTFVPCGMCDVIYENYAGPKTKKIFHGAGHAESYYKDPAAYEQALDTFTEGIIK